MKAKAIAIGSTQQFGKYLVLQRTGSDIYQLNHVPTEFQIAAFSGVSGEACRAVARELAGLGEVWNVDPNGDTTPLAELHYAMVEACERQKLERFQGCWRPRPVG